MFLPSNITLKFGDSGDFVAELQRRLAMVKCFTEDQVNGFYDGNTVNAVMQFQGMSGLQADGVAGPETLRRLNGVIAGDTSGGADDKKEEEAQRQMTETNALNLALAEQQQPQPGIWGEPAPTEQAPAPIEPAPAPVGLDPAMFAPAAATAALAQQGLSEAMRVDIARQENISPNPARELTDLVMAAAEQQQQHQSLANTAQAPQPAPQAPQVPPPETLQPMPQPVPLQPVPLEQAAAAVPQQEPQGLMQRAGRFANAMMQRLSDYFEAKLPPSVMAEVKAAGQVMAQSGVKEAPIPTGPEMGGPAQQLPTRGPEQQQVQAR